MAQFQDPKDGDIEEEDADHVIDEQPLITSSDALTALRTLRLHQEQQEEGDTGLIRQLNRLEIKMQRLEAQNRRQVDIRGYFEADRGELGGFLDITNQGAAKYYSL